MCILNKSIRNLEAFQTHFSLNDPCLGDVAREFCFLIIFMMLYLIGMIELLLLHWSTQLCVRVNFTPSYVSTFPFVSGLTSSLQPMCTSTGTKCYQDGIRLLALCLDNGAPSSVGLLRSFFIIRVFQFMVGNYFFTSRTQGSYAQQEHGLEGSFLLFLPSFQW